MKARLKNVLWLGISFVFILTSYNNLFSQDPHDLKKQIRETLETRPRWLSYKAFIEKNTDICSNASGEEDAPQDCWMLTKFIVFVQSLAKGNCNSLPPQYSDFKDLCTALRDTQCSSVGGYKKSMCEALRSKDTNLMISVMSDPQYPYYTKDKKSSAEYLINLYWGFQNGSETACDRFTPPNLLRAASCNMLFGNRSFERKLDILAQDLFYAAQSKAPCDRDKCAKSCGNINDSNIKLLCEDDSVKGLSGIMQKIWE